MGDVGVRDATAAVEEYDAVAGAQTEDGERVAGLVGVERGEAARGRKSRNVEAREIGARSGHAGIVGWWRLGARSGKQVMGNGKRECEKRRVGELGRGAG